MKSTAWRKAIPGLSVFLALAGCTTNMPAYEAGQADSPRKVLIAGEDTAFKRSVVLKVIEKLGAHGWYIKVIGLDRLAAQDTEPFGTIVIMAGYRGGRLDSRVSDFLLKDPANGKVVLFYTRGAESPMPESARPKLGVDAVSTASRDDRVETRAGQLAALIEERF